MLTQLLKKYALNPVDVEGASRVHVHRDGPSSSSSSPDPDANKLAADHEGLFGLQTVHCRDVIPDYSNRGHTGLSVEHVHKVAQSIAAGFRRRDITKFENECFPWDPAGEQKAFETWTLEGPKAGAGASAGAGGADASVKTAFTPIRVADLRHREHPDPRCRGRETHLGFDVPVLVQENTSTELGRAALENWVKISQGEDGFPAPAPHLGSQMFESPSKGHLAGQADSDSDNGPQAAGNETDEWAGYYGDPELPEGARLRDFYGDAPSKDAPVSPPPNRADPQFRGDSKGSDLAKEVYSPNPRSPKELKLERRRSSASALISPRADKKGREVYCSLGNGHFFQALNLFRLRKQSIWKNDASAFVAASAQMDRRNSGAGLGQEQAQQQQKNGRYVERYAPPAPSPGTPLTHDLWDCLQHGVPALILRNDVPLQERLRISELLNKKSDYRWSIFPGKRYPQRVGDRGTPSSASGAGDSGTEYSASEAYASEPPKESWRSQSVDLNSLKQVDVKQSQFELLSKVLDGAELNCLVRQEEGQTGSSSRAGH